MNLPIFVSKPNANLVRGTQGKTRTAFAKFSGTFSSHAKYLSLNIEFLLKVKC